MPATETRRRSGRGLKSANVVEQVAPELGEDGWPLKRWQVGSEEQVFSLRPYREDEKIVYWNPIYIGQTMLWRAQEINEFGVQPVIQREAWVDGKFAPRNDWERQMTEEYLLTLPGGDPVAWRGYNHPDNEPGKPPHQWRCECAWLCGCWKAFRAHQQYLKHRESMSE
jgi:hypothetical protein